MSGGKFDKDGNLEAHSLLVRTLAKIATAIVGQIGSEKFVDGFSVRASKYGRCSQQATGA